LLAAVLVALGLAACGGTQSDRVGRTAPARQDSGTSGAFGRDSGAIRHDGSDAGEVLCSLEVHRPGASLVDGGVAGPLDCTLNLPQTKNRRWPFNPDAVAVRYTSNTTGVLEILRRLDGAGDCSAAGDNGWYYDSATLPTRILLCPGTCSRFATGVLGVLDCTDSNHSGPPP
jgi:hypothetical protein